MKYFAHINVMPQKALLDPQGRAVSSSMAKLDLKEIQNVRIGKHIVLEINADSKEVAAAKAELACKKLLANPIMETYEFVISE